MGELKRTASAFWKHMPVTVRESRKAQLIKTAAVKHQAKIVLSMEHENLLQFLGACFEKEHVMLIYDFANKGSLKVMYINVNALYMALTKFCRKSSAMSR